ncbi:PLP-dependent aminotransferase family protein [Deferribacterales bacterium RsTz2092]|nr:aspartate aminotransferase [Deferribacterales bacterium]
MQYRLSKKVQTMRPSFVDKIFALIASPDIISFAGGLPGREHFPVAAIKAAADKVLSEETGSDALQYSGTPKGYPPLVNHIVKRYAGRGLNVLPEEILVLNGSQQAMDLTAKVFIDEGDGIIVENPSYLGALDGFTYYQPKFTVVQLEKDGVNLEQLEAAAKDKKNKIFYSVPTFQNPTGLTYSDEKRKKAAEILAKNNVMLFEDDPYGELRFKGQHPQLMTSFAPDNSVIYGSFSKIISPGVRLGWLRAPKALIDKFVLLKQATDLHSGTLTQRIVAQFLQDNNIDEHIAKVSKSYAVQCQAMLDAMKEYFHKTFNWCI